MSAPAAGAFLDTIEKIRRRARVHMEHAEDLANLLVTLDPTKEGA